GRTHILNENYAGLFARWVARVTIEDSDPEKGLQMLSREFPIPDNLHPKDRAELRASRAGLLRFSGTLDVEEADSIRMELSTLPPGISMLLKGFGLHPDHAVPN